MRRLSGFTALTEARGHAEAADVAAGFFAGPRALLAEHGGHEAKPIVDAIRFAAIAHAAIGPRPVDE